MASKNLTEKFKKSRSEFIATNNTNLIKNHAIHCRTHFFGTLGVN